MAEFKVENLVFEHASYLNDFDDGYNQNEDPDYEDPEGLDDSEYDTEDDIDEEFKLDDDEFDDTRVCFRAESHGTLLGQSLGPCDHICCKVWHLEPIHQSKPDSMCPMIRCVWLTMIRHINECTDTECKNPNATGILVKARILARASKIFNSRTAARLKSKAKAFRTTV